ncbi:MAG: ATP-dependent metalloprotease FtsH [Actinomycetia bacterium]|nr:ATP-dependent metalloprotease FtsH [Actinomycetes bacterium]
MSRRPPTPDGQTPPRPASSGSSFPRWLWWVALATVVAIVVALNFSPKSTSQEKLSYSQFISAVKTDKVSSIKYDQSNGKIVGAYKKGDEVNGHKEFEAQGPKDQIPPSDYTLITKTHNVQTDYKPQSSNIIGTVLLYLLPVLLLIGFFIWMNRRAQGQMGAVMNIGRSKGKVYNTENPKTTFADVAGYGPVKEEITEVVDFLKSPGKFREIGARIPKGVLLVGPPGTGKTLIARAVAGEAGVPFISVTGSDFMEMFVGVGAARVRDLFQSARKQSPAIIFIDEIDSIGRKRGAGVGGGHDEREQTLNQMLAEMDGFEGVEGIVMIGATNRPDVLDPALLRPGRFDRMVMVPLPTQDERTAILKVHFRDKRIAGDVRIDVISRGTPGMSGADLANLVNEAALFAVRRGASEVHAEDFDAARDRVLMGLKRESMALTEEEKEITAYHEGGHAVTSYVLEHADPVHKVTILPTGMALGMTQNLPVEERHIYKKDYFDDMLVMFLGGRIAEEIVFKHLSSGASNDLQRATEVARKMVREWGFSERVGPMAWGSQGAVFLGEDLVHTRDYSDDTARVIDEEVEHILRTQEDRTRKTLTEYRAGLDAVARALLERETLDGAEVGRLVDEAMGRKSGGPRKIVHADGSVTEAVDPDIDDHPLSEGFPVGRDTPPPSNGGDPDAVAPVPAD